MINANKKKWFLYVFCFILFVFISAFSTDKSDSTSSLNQVLEDSTEYPISDLYLLKDINNQPLLAQLTKYPKDKIKEIQKSIKVHLYPSSVKANDSILSVKGLVFNLGQNPDVSKFSVSAEAIPMTKADSLAEIKRFGGLLYKNGKTSKPAKSYSGIIQPRFLKLYSKNYQDDKTNKIKQIAEGSITAKNKLYQREELVFKKSKSTLRLIVLENRTKENYVLKLAFEGEDKFVANPNAYIQLIGYAGEFSIPLGTFVSDAINPNYLYLPIEKELVEKLLAGKANYSLKFQNPVAYQFSEIRLNQF
ncbi:MAG: hypothetical protein COZ18_01850 [Flexibacter sp. CG_4_10_14_3_um_filter_32_15]|nr:MAG: hypothetical protein COZ18_01850 [Flexibacter sp. CG_4_10_14_3_um_filter_32_15]